MITQNLIVGWQHLPVALFRATSDQRIGGMGPEPGDQTGLRGARGVIIYGGDWGGGLSSNFEVSIGPLLSLMPSDAASGEICSLLATFW